MLAFGAEPIYDNMTPADPPFTGPDAERQLGLAGGTALLRMRMLRLGEGAMLELFEMRGPDQRPPARPSDFGFQHVAIYVDDMAAACSRFTDAGGTLLTAPSPMLGAEKGENNSFCYGRAPWGMMVELLTSPSPEAYEATTAARRWTPPRQTP